MRALFITITFVVLCSCAPKASYYDLRHPVYVMAYKSFWLGCEDDSGSAKACREYRVEQVYAGFNQWFNYFDKANRPRAVFVFSAKQLPAHLVNKVIYLGISEKICRDELAAACYFGKSWWYWPLKDRIMLKNSTSIQSIIIAHEVGHAFGRDDNDVPEGTDSVMSYKRLTHVTPLDFKMMCKKHRECRMVKHKRHK